MLRVGDRVKVLEGALEDNVPPEYIGTVVTILELNIWSEDSPHHRFDDNFVTHEKNLKLIGEPNE